MDRSTLRPLSQEPAQARGREGVLGDDEARPDDDRAELVGADYGGPSLEFAGFTSLFAIIAIGAICIGAGALVMRIAS